MSGLSLSNPSSTLNSKLLVTKSNTAGLLSLGTASLAGVSSGSTSWAQISGSLSSDTIIGQILATCPSSALAGGAFLSADIGIGGAGSESVISTVYLQSVNGTGSFRAVGTAPVLARVASGQRLAVRLNSPDGTNGSTITVGVTGAAYANVEGN